MTLLWTIYLWIVSTLLGIVVFPALFHAVPRLKDRGWGISRVVGLVAVTWLAWLLSSFKILPFGWFGILAAAAGAAAVSAWFVTRGNGGIGRFLKKNASLIVFEEGVFIASLAVFLFVIAHNPDIAPNTEAMMDYAMLNSVVQTDYFPALDSWFAGRTINYYYYGFILSGVLQHLTAIPLPVFFNLAVGLMYALFTLALFSLGYNLTGKRSIGVLLAFLGMFAGNLDGFIQFLQGDFANFNFFRSSRVLTQIEPGNIIIDYPITEFPFFSLLWGDLHPYVIAYPLQAAVITLLLNLAGAAKTGLASLGEKLDAGAANLLFLALSTGVLFGTNTWDYPIYLFLGVLVLGLIHWRAEGKPAEKLTAFLLPAAALTVLSFILFAPFNLRFLAEQAEGGRGGIGLVTVRTPTPKFLVHFGIFFFFLTVYATTRLVSIVRGRRAASASKKRGAPLALLVLITAVVLIQNPPWGLFAYAVVPAAIFFLAYLALTLFPKRGDDGFPCLVILSGLGLILLCEFFYLVDHYTGGGYFRMNTVFKLYIHAWIFLAVGAVWGYFSVGRMIPENSSGRRLWTGAMALAVIVGFFYPWGALNSRLKNSANLRRAGRDLPTLDGTAYIPQPVPAHQREDWRWDHDDWLAIEWINDNIPGRPVILETAANAYHWASRVSTFTGLPTIVGWMNHQAGWRNDWTEPSRRGRDVDTIYSTTDAGLARRIMNNYGVEYVFIGNLERGRYPRPGLEKFERLGREVYRRGAVTIYRVGR